MYHRIFGDLDEVTNKRRRDESEEESEEEDIATYFVIQLDASDKDDSLSGAQDILM